jgi:N,N'-diacetylchitobiose transport system substrate-binding protein
LFERERAVKVRHLAAAALTAALAIAVTGCQKDSTGDKGSGSEPSTLTVWLMKGSAPDDLINSVNTDFESTHKGVKVKVELQEWADITTKTTTALASNTPPDVIEVGNSLTSGFAAAGGLKDLTASKDALGGGDWVKALADSGTVGDKLYGVPYYAATHVLLYRKDLFTAAGIAAPPKTVDELVADGTKLKAKNAKTKDFSTLACPGKYWYFFTSFVYANGGSLATDTGGTWKGNLSSPESQKGLTQVKDVCGKLSQYDKAKDEANPPQVNDLGTGKSASADDAGWQVGTITTAHPELKDKIGVSAFPGLTADTAMPAFLGGSNLAVSAGTKSPNNAVDYLKLLTGTKYQTEFFQKGKILPNTNALVAQAAADPAIKPMADAAKAGWFTPSNAHWSEVEQSNVLQDMYVNILTGKKSVADAAKAADDVITQTLNKK